MRIDEKQLFLCSTNGDSVVSHKGQDGKSAAGRYGIWAALLLGAALVCAGCGGADNASRSADKTGAVLETADSEENAADEQEAGETLGDSSVADDTDTSSEPAESGEQDSQSGAASQVADASEMAERVDVLEEGMVPVTAEELTDGSYPVEVSSSSTMFKIVSCQLTVEGGQLSAVMTMGGTGYQYVYMGTGEQAVAADEKEYIPYEENEAGEHTFTVPVQALDAAVDCAAFSKKKEKWYDRTLVFRADSLPAEAFKSDVLVTADSLKLEDGEYTVQVTLEGGSGRSTVESPAKLTVQGGTAYATIVWSSKNYDYMLVDGVQYDNENPEGNSTFVIPVKGFDRRLPVVGDTTAMSTPYEIDYTLLFDSGSIQKAE